MLVTRVPTAAAPSTKGQKKPRPRGGKGSCSRSKAKPTTEAVKKTPARRLFMRPIGCERQYGLDAVGNAVLQTSNHFLSLFFMNPLAQQPQPT